MYSDFYKIPLPALRFEKVEETHREVNDTEENNARPRQKYKEAENVTKDDIRLSSTQAKNNKQTKSSHASQTTKRRQKTKNVNKRFQDKDDPEPRVTDNANQIKTVDLKKKKVQASF